MKTILTLLIIILLQNCNLSPVIQHHGVHNLEIKQKKIEINKTNKNDIIKIIGPPSTISTFDNDLYFYIEKKTSSSKITKIGAKNLLVNNVLILELNDKGILVSKKLYTKADMQKIEFDKNTTENNYSKDSFINRFLFSVKQKIDDPTGKKRTTK